MRFYLSGALLLLASISACAQSYKPGYYITNSGDTVKTEIFMINQFSVPIKLQLKNNTLLGPKSIKGFGIAGADYVSRIVSVDKSPAGGIVSDTVFLQVIADGKMSLLYYRDEAPKTHFLIVKEDGTMEELGLKILDLGDHKQFTQLTVYRDVLKKNFPECGSLFAKIDKTPYDVKSIQEIFLKLYECKYSKDPIVTTFPDRPYVEAGVIGGFSNNSISFDKIPNSSVSPGYSYMKFKDSQAATFGIFLDVVVPRLKLFDIRNEIIFSSYAASSPEIIIDPSPASEYRASASLSNRYIRYNLLLRKGLSEGNKVTPFVNVGGSFSLLISHDGELHETKSNYGVKYLDYTFPFSSDYSKYELGLMIGGGVFINKFGVEARYEISNGMRPIENLTPVFSTTRVVISSPVSSVYVLVSYKIIQHKKQDK